MPKLEQHKGKDGEVIFETYNFPDGKNDDRWYDWRVQNWGTKWDCYDLSIDEDEQELNLEFNTAWSPPEEICRALKDKFEDADIQWFYDEPGMEFAGYL